VPIFDQGYQHWSGRLSSQAWRWLAITRQGVRTGLRLTRLKRTLFIAWLPALGLAVFLCVWGLIERKANLVASLLPALKLFGEKVMDDPRQIRVEVWTIAYSYFMNIELLLSMVLILLAGPNLISQDLRFNALPLYFSRPLRRIDYFLGKLGVIGAFLAMVTIGPAVVAYILGMLFSLDITILGDTLPILTGAIFYGLLIIVSAGALMLALSSLSRNSRYVTLIWAAIWFVTGGVSSILVKIEHEQRDRAIFYNYRSQIPPSEQEANDGMSPLEQKFVEEDRRDWRPLVSYLENLRRIGRNLMRTDAAWEQVRTHLPPQQREMFRTHYMDAEYPWYWSAAVLAVLFGLSLWILHFRVRSLDRLK
jgi:ABC-2 type transport system permease protein